MISSTSLTQLLLLLLLLAMALLSPTMPSLSRRTIWFALTTAREILWRIYS